MIRSLLVPLLGSALLLAATAGSALAKCEETVDPKPAKCSMIVAVLDVGGVPQAGTSQSVDIYLSQGEQPFVAQTVVLILTSNSDGSRLTVPATAASEPGRWTAELLLPDEGSWGVSAKLEYVIGQPFEVAVSTDWGGVLPARAPETPPVTAPPVAPASPVLPVALVLGGLAGAALAGQVIRNRSRRRTAGAGVAAGSAATVDRA
ncbi:MAG: hypothetical protein WEB29_01500 [Chloroflexota bacterium]